MDLVYVHQVNLAEGLFARLSSQAELTLIDQEDLDIVQAPRHELPRQALVLAVADFAHEAVVQDVFVIGGQPDILLLSLDLAQDQERIRRLESDRLGLGHAQVVHAAFLRLGNRVELGVNPLLDPAPLHL